MLFLVRLSSVGRVLPGVPQTPARHPSGTPDLPILTGLCSYVSGRVLVVAV
jgi:hypothetical protein